MKFGVERLYKKSNMYEFRENLRNRCTWLNVGEWMFTRNFYICWPIWMKFGTRGLHIRAVYPVLSFVKISAVKKANFWA
jgi:hypothetical protein